MEGYSILVASRNRPIQLQTLLSSIVALSHQPEEVIIVTSGDSSEPLQKTFPTLRIIHQHVDGIGQVFQKAIGTNLISDSVPWVLFCDDDVTLEPSSVEILLGKLATFNAESLPVGLGLRDSIFVAKVGRTLRRNLVKSKWGKVTRSGFGISYMKSNRISQVQWLNGISMWRRDMLTNYQFPYQNSQYAACEDLIFSYRCGKYGSLFYVPTALYTQQSYTRKHNYLSRLQLKSLINWRLYFVHCNPEFSRIWFYLRHIVLCFTFAFRGPKQFMQKFRDLSFSLSHLGKSAIKSIQFKNPDNLIRELEAQPTTLS